MSGNEGSVAPDYDNSRHSYNGTDGRTISTWAGCGTPASAGYCCRVRCPPYPTGSRGVSGGSSRPRNSAVNDSRNLQRQLRGIPRCPTLSWCRGWAGGTGVPRWRHRCRRTTHHQRTRRAHVRVRFSCPTDEPSGRRWSHRSWQASAG